MCVLLFKYVLPLTCSLSLFSACPQGTFKSFQGAGLCQQCPLNSRSTIEAATLCGCRNGYYRGDMDKPEDVCTSELVSLSQINTKSKDKSLRKFSVVQLRLITVAPRVTEICLQRCCRLGLPIAVILQNISG